MKVWDEERETDPSSGDRPDWFTVGLADMWGAGGSRLTASRGIGGGTVSGMMEGVAVIIFLVGRDVVPRFEVERESVLTIDDMAEGSVVSCIGSAAVPSGS